MKKIFSTILMIAVLFIANLPMNAQNNLIRNTEEKEKVKQIVIEEMEKAYTMQVPLRADCGWGKNCIYSIVLLFILSNCFSLCFASFQCFIVHDLESPFYMKYSYNYNISALSCQCYKCIILCILSIV